MSKSYLFTPSAVRADVRGTYTVPLPLGRPRALTVGEVGMEGNTEDRKLEAGDGGIEEGGEDMSE